VTKVKKGLTVLKVRRVSMVPKELREIRASLEIRVRKDKKELMVPKEIQEIKVQLVTKDKKVRKVK
jgi:hypothetical protein